jgi:putative transposase
MDAYQLRQEAVTLYLQGGKVAVIARALGKSRKWVHHWINCYKGDPGAVNWFEDQSKAPKKTNGTLDPQIEQQVLLIRAELMQRKMAQVGAISIQYELEHRGIKPLPEIWTINRIIAKHGLSKESAGYKSSKEYPALLWRTHQMDLVGPRYIKGDGKFYSINLIDTTTHSCFVKVVRTKSSDGIVEAIASFWRTHGLPEAMQMDNELAFRGSNIHNPRSYGRVIRFILSQGVAVVFIPVKEPWRNGIIEKFNHTYQKRFLQSYPISCYDDLSMREQAFIDFHNTHHRYSSQGHKTPNEMIETLLEPTYYTGNEHLQAIKGSLVRLPLKGCIYYIRFIRSDLKLYLPNESFTVIADLKYSYVVVEINTDNHSMIIRQNGEIKQEFIYIIRQ